MIKKLKNGKYRVVAESGRNMGEYTSKSQAEKRLKTIEMFKHMKSKADDGPKNPIKKNLDYGDREKILKEKEKRLKRKAAVEELLKIASEKKILIPKEIYGIMKESRQVSVGRLNPLRRIILAQGFLTPDQAEYLKQAAEKISRFSKIASMGGSNSFDATLAALGGDSFLEWIRGLK